VKQFHLFHCSALKKLVLINAEQFLISLVVELMKNSLDIQFFSVAPKYHSLILYRCINYHFFFKNGNITDETFFLSLTGIGSRLVTLS